MRTRGFAHLRSGKGVQLGSCRFGKIISLIQWFLSVYRIYYCVMHYMEWKLVGIKKLSLLIILVNTHIYGVDSCVKLSRRHIVESSLFNKMMPYPSWVWGRGRSSSCCMPPFISVLQTMMHQSHKD